jgi:hypothetical protein
MWQGLGRRFAISAAAIASDDFNRWMTSEPSLRSHRFQPYLGARRIPIDRIIVSHAFIPFSVALVFFRVLIWRVMEWWKDAAARSAGKMAEQVESLKNTGLPAEAPPVLDQLTYTTSQFNRELFELGKANTFSTSSSVGLWQSENRTATLPTAPDRPVDKK